MLMMRPLRWRIIALTARREQTNAERRLVFMTVSHCSSDMRISKLSRVVPALLISTSRPPSALLRLVDD